MIIIIELIFILNFESYGQNSNNPIISEFQFSINRTTLKDENTQDRYGFGFGIYHSFMSKKMINIILGIEYNRTSQFKEYMYEAHFAHLTDVTYNLNCFSFPLGLRLNIGSKTKVFIETGGFADIVIYSHKSGTYHSYQPGDNNIINYFEKKIEESANLSNSVGFYFGIGFRIPISRFELIIKPEYKYGINKLYSYQDDILNRYFRINFGLKI
jgi:hypothetical protein